MKPERRFLTDKKGLTVSKLLGVRVLLALSILVLLLLCTAWRPFESRSTGAVDNLWPSMASVLATPVINPTLQANEISQQLGESNGIILAGVVIVLIILGGTYGATRRKDQ